MLIDLVISGGQTGVDQAGWRAAAALAIPTDGWMPRGFRTETRSGKGWGESHPELASRFGAREHTTELYQDRTPLNAAWAHVTLWYGAGDSSGYFCTSNGVKEAGRTLIDVTRMTPEEAARKVEAVVRFRGYRELILNVAGNRESSRPGIGAEAEAYFLDLFCALIGTS